MNQKPSQIAQRLINLYRQAHVIVGGWRAVNQIFVADADADVMMEMRTMPTGAILARHIENLRSGKTPMDSIERELMPYGGMMADSVVTEQLPRDEMQQLENAINAFTPDEMGLDALTRTPVIRKFGPEWMPAVRAALASRPDLMEKFNVVVQTQRAYSMWNNAATIITRPIGDRERAQIQADMPEYETFLPMFGDAGNDLLAKLRLFISSRDAGDVTSNVPGAI